MHTVLGKSDYTTCSLETDSGCVLLSPGSGVNVITYKGWPIHPEEVGRGHWSATISAPVGYVDRPGEGEAVAVYDTKKEAIEAAMRLIDETFRCAGGRAP